MSPITLLKPTLFRLKHERIMSFPCSLTLAGSYEIKKKNPQHCNQRFPHISPSLRLHVPPSSAAKHPSLSYLSTLSFSPWNALPCLVKSYSIFKIQTKNYPPSFHPPPNFVGPWNFKRTLFTRTV